MKPGPPRKLVVCDECGWSGHRVRSGRACPNCGHWHPRVADAGEPLPTRPTKKPVVMYRIWSRVYEMWYRENGKGYTDSPHEAGRFTKVEAKKHCGPNWRNGVKRRGCSEVPVPV